MQNYLICPGTVPAGTQYFTQEWVIPYHEEQNVLNETRLYFLDPEWKTWVIHASLYVGLEPIYVCELELDSPSGHLAVRLPVNIRVLPNNMTRLVFSGTRLQPLLAEKKFALLMNCYPTADTRTDTFLTVIDEYDTSFHRETGETYNAHRLARSTEWDGPEPKIEPRPTYVDVPIDVFEFQRDGKLVYKIDGAFKEVNIHLGEANVPLFKVVHNKGCAEPIIDATGWKNHIVGTRIKGEIGLISIECDSLAKFLSAKDLCLKARIIYESVQ